MASINDQYTQLFSIEDQYNILNATDEFELKKVTLIICTKPGAKYQIQNWNKTTKCASYFVKEFSNNGRLYNVSSAQIISSVNNIISKRAVNSLISRLIEGGYVDRYPNIKKVEDKLSKSTVYTTDKYQYTLLPTDKLLDLFEEHNIPFPDKSLICKYREDAIKDTEKVNVTKVVEDGVKTTITRTTDAYGNRKEKVEVDVDEVYNRLDKIKQEEHNLNMKIAYNGQEYNINPTKPLIRIEDNDCD